jgi:hypothetical protein
MDSPTIAHLLAQVKAAAGDGRNVRERGPKRGRERAGID